MKYLSLLVLLAALATPAAAQDQTTFRDASGRTTGTVTTDSNGTKTFRDGSGRTTGTATTNSNGTTTFRDFQRPHHWYRYSERTMTGPLLPVSSTKRMQFMPFVVLNPSTERPRRKVRGTTKRCY